MERDAAKVPPQGRPAISIHALRMERDSGWIAGHLADLDFNPRAPHGARLTSDGVWEDKVEFQSTRSAWSATP